MRRLNLKPSILRCVYDAFVSLYALGFVFFINEYSIKDNGLYLFSLLLLYSLLLGLTGIYNKRKFASVTTKSLLIITVSFLLVSLSYLLFSLTSPAIQFVSIAAPMLILARVFLNVNNRFIRLSTKLSSGPRKVLVIGGAGYIGTHTIRLLLEKGYYVRVLDTFMFGKDPIKEFISHKNFSYIEGDATNVMALSKAMQQIDTVIHLAGLVGDPACAVDSELTLHSNVVTARLAKDLAIAAGVRRFIFASSCSVYGVNENVVDETMELNPVSLYAKTKISTENELLKVSVDDFNPTILRFSTVFGHSNRQRFDLVGNLFTAQAFNDKAITVIGADQWRPFVHVKDLARAICCVIEAPIEKVSGEIFNVGDDDLNRTIMGLASELTTAYESVFGDKVEIKNIEMDATDKRNYRVSFDKINSVLGFKCETTFNQGFVEMLINFKNGVYEDFKEKKYSNLAVTKELLSTFGSLENKLGKYTSLDALQNEEAN